MKYIEYKIVGTDVSKKQLRSRIQKLEFRLL